MPGSGPRALPRGCRLARAAALAPGDGELQATLGQTLTVAAEGRVTPEARAAFAAALERLPADPRARYYLALADWQDGARAKAIAAWQALVSLTGSTPVGRTVGQRVAARLGRSVGIDPDLDQAAKQALRAMIDFICERKNLTREQAYALCSIICDLRISQIVNQHKGVHAMLPRSLVA